MVMSALPVLLAVGLVGPLPAVILGVGTGLMQSFRLGQDPMGVFYYSRPCDSFCLDAGTPKAAMAKRLEAAYRGTGYPLIFVDYSCDHSDPIYPRIGLR